MSVTIGNYTPGFKFRLNSQPANVKIISSASSGLVTGHLIDANYTITTFNNSVTGTQYLVNVIPEQFVVYGQNPVITLASSNTGIATVDTAGNVGYVSAGNFNISGSYNSNSYYAGQSVILPLVNSSGGLGTSLYTTYTSDQINISNHVLIVYNTNSIDSLNLKNYYTGHRPQFGNANILGISVPSGQEIISYSGFTGLIRQPIVNYLTGVSGTKPIRYVVFMLDIPTRVGDTNIQSVSFQLYQAYQQLGLRNGSDYNQSPNHFSLGQYQQNTFLSSYINFGTYQDCTSYIDKISAGQTGVYLSGNGTNTGYYIEDVGQGIAPTYFSGRNLRPLINQFPSVPYVYRSNVQSHIITGDNLAGYISFGTDGGLGVFYATNGTIKWNNSPNQWYSMLTVDSLNGQRAYNQGNFITWFSSGAFGGSGYNNCPVAAVGNVEEPYLFTSCISGFFNLWQSEYPFIECAWQSRITDKFAVFGDPFIIK